MDSMCSPDDHVGRSDKTCFYFDVLSEERKQCGKEGGLETGGDLGDSKQHNAGILNYRAGGAGGRTEHRPAARPPPFTPNLRHTGFSQLHFMKMHSLTHLRAHCSSNKVERENEAMTGEGGAASAGDAAGYLPGPPRAAAAARGY